MAPRIQHGAGYVDVEPARLGERHVREDVLVPARECRPGLTEHHRKCAARCSEAPCLRNHEQAIGRDRRADLLRVASSDGDGEHVSRPDDVLLRIDGPFERDVFNRRTYGPGVSESGCLSARRQETQGSVRSR